MKYAFMSFSAPDLRLDELLALARRLGYDGIEPRTASGHGHSIELDISMSARQTIRRQVADAGVALCCLAVSCRYADPAAVEREVEETQRYISLAADIGAPRLRVFGGKIAEGIDRATAIANVAAALREVADHAAERGVTVCMETHDDWCNPAHVAAVMAQVNHSFIAVNWDIMHPVRTAGYTMESAFVTLRPWIRHVHFHDGANRRGKIEYLPLGEGEFDNRRAVALLHSAGYNGYLSGEWINWEPAELHLPRELARVKQYEGEVSSL
jgi:sugar phosphate isomerase/epimerase